MNTEAIETSDWQLRRHEFHPKSEQAEPVQSFSTAEHIQSNEAILKYKRTQEMLATSSVAKRLGIDPSKNAALKKIGLTSDRAVGIPDLSPHTFIQKSRQE